MDAMNVLVVVLAVSNIAIISLVAAGVILAARSRKTSDDAETEISDSVLHEDDDTDEIDSDEYTVEMLMEQAGGPMVMATSLHEMQRAFRAAGFSKVDADGLLHTMLHAHIVAQSED